jgi:predicted GIY-YIG superfamily endonuclease
VKAYGPYPHGQRWRIVVEDALGNRSKQSFATEDEAKAAMDVAIATGPDPRIDALMAAVLASAVELQDDALWVYLLKDGDGAVIYVGVTGSVGRRIGEHESRRGLTAATTLVIPTPFPRAVALRLEEALIRTLQPLHNRMYVGATAVGNGNR